MSPVTTPGPDRVVVVVAHGSADPRAAATITDLMTVVAERAARRGVDIPDLCTAYLGHVPPSLPQVMSGIDPGTQVTVLPLLLTAAYHSKTDIPRVLARVRSDFPYLRVTYGAALGPHPLLTRALERRLAEADPGVLEDPARTGVVLAAAGSSDPDANATIGHLAARWQARAGWFAVRPAYASVAHPSPAEAVTRLLRDGARRAVVATYLLAPGYFADRTRDRSLAAGAAAVSPVLGASAEVADVLLDRFQVSHLTAILAAWEMVEASMSIGLLPHAAQHLLRSTRNPRQDLVTGYLRELFDRPVAEFARSTAAQLAALRTAQVHYLFVAGAAIGPDYQNWLNHVLPQAIITVWPASGHFSHLAHPRRFAEYLAATVRWSTRRDSHGEQSVDGGLRLLTEPRGGGIMATGSFLCRSDIQADEHIDADLILPREAVPWAPGLSAAGRAPWSTRSPWSPGPLNTARRNLSSRRVRY